MSHSPIEVSPETCLFLNLKDKISCLFGKKRRHCIALNEETFKEHHPFFQQFQKPRTPPPFITRKDLCTVFHAGPSTINEHVLSSLFSSCVH